MESGRSPKFKMIVWLTGVRDVERISSNRKHQFTEIVGAVLSHALSFPALKDGACRASGQWESRGAGSYTIW